MMYLLHAEHVSYGDVDIEWTLFVTDAPIDLVAEYAEKNNLGEIVLFDENLNPMIGYSQIDMNELQMRRRLEEMRRKAERDHLEWEISIYNITFENQISEVERILKQDIEKVKRGLKIYRFVPKAQVNEKLISKFIDDGFVEDTEVKGKVRFIHKDADKFIKENEQKQHELRAVADKKIEELNSKMKKLPE